MGGTLPKLRAGDLKTKIEIVRQQNTLDRGEPVEGAWEVIASPWAEVLGQNAREAVIGHVLQGIAVYRIRIRFRSDILPSDQIRLPGNIDLNIKPPVDPNGDREQLLIIADTQGAQKTT